MSDSSSAAVASLPRAPRPASAWLTERFGALTERWRSETGGYSSPAQIASHDAYLSIIALGCDAVPLIIEELRTKGGFWYPALRALTGASPVPAEALGRPELMKRAWIEWAETNGYAAA